MLFSPFNPFWTYYATARAQLAAPSPIGTGREDRRAYCGRSRRLWTLHSIPRRRRRDTRRFSSSQVGDSNGRLRHISNEELSYLMFVDQVLLRIYQLLISAHAARIVMPGTRISPSILSVLKRPVSSESAVPHQITAERQRKRGPQRTVAARGWTDGWMDDVGGMRCILGYGLRFSSGIKSR